MNGGNLQKKSLIGIITFDKIAGSISKRVCFFLNSFICMYENIPLYYKISLIIKIGRRILLCGNIFQALI